MIEIKDLLARFNHILLGEEGKIESIRSAISEVIGIEVDSKDIRVKNNTIFLNIKPIYKNEIFMKRDKIFSKLENSLGKRSPIDIR